MKKSLLLLCAVLCVFSVFSAADVTWDKITYSGNVDDAEIVMAEHRYRKRMFSPINKCISLQNMDRTSFHRLVERYPLVPRLEISGCPWLKDLSSLTTLKKLRVLTFTRTRRDEALDLTGVELLPALEELVVATGTVRAWTPLKECSALRRLECRFVSVPEFSALVASPRLEEVSFQNATLTTEGWRSLGLLCQVKNFNFAHTGMESLEWVKNMPQVESMSIFAESIRDYSPLATVPNLKSFRALSMHGIVDLSFARDCPRLETLEVPCSSVMRLSSLAGAASLRKLDLSELKTPCDVKFVSSLPKLEVLAVDRTRIQNFDAIKAVPTLRTLSLTNLSSDSNVSVQGLESCRLLESVTLSKGAFPELDLRKMEFACKLNMTKFKLIQK